MPDAPSIVKGVTVPDAMRYTASARRKYPFEALEVNDMFFVPNQPKNILATRASALSKKYKCKFITRMLWMHRNPVDGIWSPCERDAPGAVYGVGVWRTK